MKAKFGIHWFRQDLRIENNPSLISLSEKVQQVIPIYIFDTNQRIGSVSKWWLEKSISSLSLNISKHGGKLNIFMGQPEKIISSIIKGEKFDLFSWNRLYDPYSINRDTKIKSLISTAKIECESHNGYLLNEPWNIKNKSGSFFKVFTPYWRNCDQVIKSNKFKKNNVKICFAKIKINKEINIEELNLTTNNKKWLKKIEKNWHPGEINAQKKLKLYILDKANNYSNGRDRPDKDFTSKLSPHLHFGEISPLQVYHDIQNDKKINILNKNKFLAELGWRDFSYNLLYYYPTMISKPIQNKFNKFPWIKNNKHLNLWQKGITGIPIVDAGMRQLYKTGWMHNRVRMIVGSFLTKNLLLHWKHGEEWFFDTLVDADVGSNSAGWQWISGCGADASPYFRIFNPILQGQKFDPNGDYVREFVPELKKIPTKYIHNPWQMPLIDQETYKFKIGENYPSPVVDLKETRDRALSAFKTIN